MQKTDQAVHLLMDDIKNKRVLEVACGEAGFSRSACAYAETVCCIDLDASRFREDAARDNLHFEIMDAARMRFPDAAFDTIVLYNAFDHVREQWDAIAAECARVVNRRGGVLVIGTWKLDTARMQAHFGDAARWRGGFLIVRLGGE